MEVRFESLHIETEVYAETSRQLPSLWNAVRSSVEVSSHAGRDCTTPSIRLQDKFCRHSLTHSLTMCACQPPVTTLEHTRVQAGDSIHLWLAARDPLHSQPGRPGF